LGVCPGSAEILVTPPIKGGVRIVRQSRRRSAIHHAGAQMQRLPATGELCISSPLKVKPSDTTIVRVEQNYRQLLPRLFQTDRHSSTFDFSRPYFTSPPLAEFGESLSRRGGYRSRRASGRFDASNSRAQKKTRARTITFAFARRRVKAKSRVAYLRVENLKSRPLKKMLY